MAIALVLCVSVALFSATAHAAAPIDSTLYTSYFFGSGYQSLTLVVCGSTAQTEGCYGSAGLGPFGKVGAMMESNPSQNLKTSTVTRKIYIVDAASGTAGTGVTLYVYKKTDTVTASSDTITVTLTNTVELPRTGGTNAVCSLAGNNGYLFIGTDQSPQAVRVAKSNLSTQSIGGFSPPINVTSITSDKYGYVTVTFGGFTSGEDGFYTFGPNGQRGGRWWRSLVHAQQRRRPFHERIAASSGERESSRKAGRSPQGDCSNIWSPVAGSLSAVSVGASTALTNAVLVYLSADAERPRPLGEDRQWLHPYLGSAGENRRPSVSRRDFQPTTVCIG